MTSKWFNRIFTKSMTSCIWKGLSEVLTILLKQITLKENTYGSVLCLLAQLNMFRSTSLQPAEWILFYPYVDYRTKEGQLELLFRYFSTTQVVKYKQILDFPILYTGAQPKIHLFLFCELPIDHPYFPNPCDLWSSKTQYNVLLQWDISKLGRRASFVETKVIANYPFTLLL